MADKCPSGVVEYVNTASGYCAYSLDHQPPGHRKGSADPRCFRSCKLKAPEAVAHRFTAFAQLHGLLMARRFALKAFQSRS